MKTIIKNCNLISPDVNIKNAFVLIEDDFIKEISDIDCFSKENADYIYDANGKMLMPGFIDIHFHGAMGFDVVDANYDGILKIAEAKLREGVTGILPTTLTLPEKELALAMDVVEKYKNNATFAKVFGIHLEGPFINCSCTGAQNPEYVRKPDIEEVKRLDKHSKVALVTYAVEEDENFLFTKKLKEKKIVPSCGHTNSNYKEFLGGKKAGLKHLTHFCNQMTKLHHREIGLVGAGLLDDDIMIEIICDKIHLSPEMIKLIFKVRSTESILLVTDAMAASGLSDGDYSLGGLPVVVKNGAARLKSNNALAGSTLSYNIGLKNIYEITGLPIEELVKTTSYNQARSLGLDKNGKIEAGYYADLVVLDKDFNVKNIFVNGKEK